MLARRFLPRHEVRAKVAQIAAKRRRRLPAASTLVGMTSAGGQVMERLLDGYRVIRHVAPPDAPFPAMLTRMPDGRSCHLVDAELLGAEWPAWNGAASGHLLAPVDVVRRTQGHAVALPVCAERVEAFLARRAAAGTRLDDGEVVTLAVSLLRGIAELTGRTDAPGEWWLTDEGRPVFVASSTGSEETTAGAGTAALLESLSQSSGRAWGAVLTDAAICVSRERIATRDLDDLEEQLFAAAGAQPLSTNALAPLRARALAPALRDPETAAEEGPLRTTRWFDVLAGHVDADLPDLVSLTTTSLWRRLRSRASGGRGRPWIVGAGLAAAMLGVGLLWPTGEGEPATAEQERSASASPVVTEPASPAPAPTAVDALTEPAPDPVTSWVQAASDALTARIGCGEDLTCLADVIEDPTREFPAGVIDLPAQERTTTLLDEFGGAAVLRIDAASGPSQLVVVVRIDDRIQLRDVHDIASPTG